MSLPTPLIHRDRAQRVMEQFGVSAMVLADPTNIYHATGFWPQTIAMGQLGTSVAVVPADRSQPVRLVTTQFLHYYFDIDAAPAGGPLKILLYTSPDGEVEGAAAPPTYFRPAPDGIVDSYERTTRASTADMLASQPPLATAQAALREAMADMQIDGAIAVDGPVAEALLGPGFTLRTAEPLLRRIRMIKSAAEIGLMRHAARNNAEAARDAIRSMKIGDSYEDLQRAFFAETGRRGGTPLFISIDSAAYTKRDGIIRDGRSFKIDAVSHYAGYHGDYGRTIFVGTPSDPLRRAMDAAIAANTAIAKILKPGARYSDVTKAGRAAIAEAGFDVLTPSSAHSVGLFHTDEAYKDDSILFAKADHLIEQDMVLSVDCPILQTDMSGTVHLEDLWLITADGCEPLNDQSEPYFQI